MCETDHKWYLFETDHKWYLFGSKETFADGSPASKRTPSTQPGTQFRRPLEDWDNEPPLRRPLKFDFRDDPMGSLLGTKEFPRKFGLDGNHTTSVFFRTHVGPTVSL